MASFRNYSDDKNKFRSFFIDFYTEKEDQSKVFIYREQLQMLQKREQQSIYVKLDHIEEFDKDLCIAIEANGKRYQNIICECIDELIYEIGDLTVKDSFDSFLSHRLRLHQQAKNETDTANNGHVTEERLTFQELKQTFPIELLRRYEAFLVARKSSESMAVRSVLSASTGKVIRVKAVVTRATQVKPMLKIATYSCDRCAAETYQEIINQNFMPLITCISESCKNETSRNAGSLHMISRSCKYVKLQELRIQEVSEQVPIGNIPRGIMVHCTGSNTRLVQPGDNVYITGVVLPTLNVGRIFGDTSTTSSYIEAHSINLISKVDSDDLSDVTAATQFEMDRLRDPEMYNILAKSIAPEIFGHEDIKKALLIMLSGGTRINPNGMKIRGSLNICLMGDPGVAKSQLLGFIDRLSPRSQYTTGRGCSGVGLTASVVKDQLTGEMTLEGGSLVLADEGVCCIDEFDKMADSDRTAIHEVMEQQTISIAKAGIMTTLNARVSILAAANPAYGRYNPRKTIEQNIDLPAALLSRFDMLWLIQDKPDRDNDLRLAQHITHVHREGEAPPVVNDTNTPLLSMSELRRYLALIKLLPDPSIPDSLAEYFVGVYVSLRKESRVDSGKESLFTSPRTLLSLLRIATGIARIHARTEVDRSDADEAMRLLESSKSSVRSNRDKVRRQAAGYKDVIYQAIRRLTDENNEVRLTDVAEKCTSMGYTPDQVNEVVDCYEQLNVWQVNIGRTRLHMI